MKKSSIAINYADAIRIVMHEQLKRFKQLMETGKISSNA